jgi:hypothetical protein
MYNSIEQYLIDLKKELAGCDRATVQDALSDAEEYLRMALEGALSDKAHKTEPEVLAPIIERYGQPAEIAAAYRSIEQRTPPAFSRSSYRPAVPATPVVATPMVTAPAAPKAVTPPAAPVPPPPPPVPDTRNILAKFFGVYADPKAWGSLLFILFVFGSGIAYFTWAVTGISVSAGLLVLVVGFPIMALFLMSVRGIALIEGRLIEALTGVRMPRRPVFSRSDVSFWQKIKNIFAERQTWTALIYMFAQLVLGIVYFSVFVALVAASLWLIFQPIIGVSFDLPAFVIGDYGYYTPGWVIPFSIIGGVLLMTATMHLVKLTGKAHAAWAKVMLVKE